MQKIFIDCGAHCGCSYRKFKKEFDTKNEYFEQLNAYKAKVKKKMAATEFQTGSNPYSEKSGPAPFMSLKEPDIECWT